MDMQKWVYHERQSGSMCAVHCLNALFQGPVVDEVKLSEIARDLDMREASLYLREPGEIVEIRGSTNVSVDGNFSIQVILRAIEARGLKTVQIGKLNEEDIPKENDPLDNDPKRCVHAFVCWLSHHWICIRKVHGYWFNMNSVNPAPQYLGYIGIGAFFDELKREGYFLYKVIGKIPECDMREAYPDNETLHGKWLPLIFNESGIPMVLNDESPKQKRRKVAKRGTTKRSGVLSYEDQLRLAMEESLKTAKPPIPDKKEEATSSRSSKPQQPPPPQQPPSANVQQRGGNLTTSEDEELQLAIALSLSMNEK